MSGEGRWSDLAARAGSAAVMVVIGLGAVMLGGHLFHVFVALVCGAMVWELARMLDPGSRSRAVMLGAMGAAALMLSLTIPALPAVAVLLVPALTGAALLGRWRLVFAGFAAGICLAGHEMMGLRDQFGWVWMLWLVLVVVASDILGYFAGKALGGPKFWPRISPKKTWSGTVAGWIGAALVGLVFARMQGLGAQLVVFSVIVGFAGQMGDIAESAVKRAVGVKDSSALIPGHGGLLDRFDGMLGASVFVFVVQASFGLPLGGG
ncbi:phosphatidate cytidylyltransferase [Pukyongiella litopenaei]|uniref:Phosphatidate cytidylyltransferase n=1 Tax=Pukyongiella litopenaei TaxID=2605946 RepID=A0A2S0MVF4_9RHOB|nr:phosphatidate cytidylyltransferase [Pukyongiella litopenaei]AVO39852.1 phosphatidate cytidylyltransferase [Pukyongiella litopenaei]